MNKVVERSKKEGVAKFYYANRKMLLEAKAFKISLYILSLIPVILSLIPAFDKVDNLVFIATMTSFGLTLFSEFASSFISAHKEKAVMLHQLYEAGLTASTFSKIEYDREMTNELNELAIRKSAPKMRKIKTYQSTTVPSFVKDEHAYLYLCRTNAASTKYLMSRMFGIYIFALVVAVILFIIFVYVKSVNDYTTNVITMLQLVIQFYPLIIPIIRNISNATKTTKKCAKISADIDNYFADGDDSIERLARFQYYVQNIEFEMMVQAPAKYALFPLVFRFGLKNLQEGVTKRFQEAVEELEKKALINKGVTVRTTRKQILTNDGVDLETLQKKKELLEKKNQVEVKPKEEIKPKATVKTTSAPTVKKVATPVKKTATPVKKDTTKKTVTTKKVSTGGKK